VYGERTTHDLQILGNVIHDNGRAPSTRAMGSTSRRRSTAREQRRLRQPLRLWDPDLPGADQVLIVHNTVVGNATRARQRRDRPGWELGDDRDNTTVVNNIVAFNASSGFDRSSRTG
jgi:hypothetical protein